MLAVVQSASVPFKEFHVPNFQRFDCTNMLLNGMNQLLRVQSSRKLEPCGAPLQLATWLIGSPLLESKAVAAQPHSILSPKQPRIILHHHHSRLLIAFKNNLQLRQHFRTSRLALGRDVA